MDCYGNILHEKGLSNSTQFLMEGISCVTPRKRLYLTNRFQVAVLLFSNRSQMTSKCGKDRKVAHEAQPSVSLSVSSERLSSNRSQVRTNQNACITELII